MFISSKRLCTYIVSTTSKLHIYIFQAKRHNNNYSIIMHIRLIPVYTISFVLVTLFVAIEQLPELCTFWLAVSNVITEVCYAVGISLCDLGLIGLLLIMITMHAMWLEEKLTCQVKICCPWKSFLLLKSWYIPISKFYAIPHIKELCVIGSKQKSVLYLPRSTRNASGVLYCNLVW